MAKTINRRKFISRMGATACLASSGGNLLFAQSRKVENPPNIILCMADDQGWGDMGYYGHPFVKTPNFDAMEKVALRFDRFYSSSPVCSPTRASVLTGRHPNRTGVLNYGWPMRPQENTIAEALRKIGYTTGHFGKWHVGSAQKNSPVNPSAFGFDEWLSAMNFFDRDPLLSRNGVVERCSGESEDIVVDEAIKFISKQAKADKPFLALVWFANPHYPHEALRKYNKLYEGKTEPGYYAEITAMDQAFGRLRKAIRDLGIRDNTLLWYNSDNGGLIESSSGGRGMKRSSYEGGLRVPALIEWPQAIPEPRHTNVPCGTMDIYPTLLELTGANKPDDHPLDGISLAPLLKGKMNARPKPIGFWRHPIDGRSTWNHKILGSILEAQKEGRSTDKVGRPDMDAGEIKKTYPKDYRQGHAGWLDWPWKLHRIVDDKNKVTLELYNLKQDPNEENNVAEQYKDRTKKMLNELTEWQTSVVRSMNGADYR